MTDKKVKVEFPHEMGGTTSEWFTWDAAIYCPGCGAKGVWVSDGSDYYAGPNHVCTRCSSISHIDTRKADNWLDEGYVNGLKALEEKQP